MSEQSDVRTGSSQSSWQPGRDSKTNSPSSSASSATGQSLIGPTVVIRGEVTAEEDLLVRGRVEGFIDHSATVTVHAEGTVAAEVKAQEVLVEGTVDGNVYGTRRVQIAESGNVNGNVYAPRVGVLEGASFKGAIDMNSDVDAIERRFREQTGTEMKADKKPSTSKPSTSKPSTSTQKDEAIAAQDEKKGNDSEATADSGSAL
jgi:cytoskeletal protein CcmA (bactofilin family)